MKMSSHDMETCWPYDDGVKRWVLRIAVFLLLGAIVNVAVAWGCSRWSNFDYRRLRLHSVAPIEGKPTVVVSPDLRWPSFVPEDWPRIPNALIGRYPGLRVWIGHMTNERTPEGWNPRPD